LKIVNCVPREAVAIYLFRHFAVGLIV